VNVWAASERRIAIDCAEFLYLCSGLLGLLSLLQVGGRAAHIVSHFAFNLWPKHRALSGVGWCCGLLQACGLASNLKHLAGAWSRTLGVWSSWCGVATSTQVAWQPFSVCTPRFKRLPPTSPTSAPSSSAVLPRYPQATGWDGPTRQLEAEGAGSIGWLGNRNSACRSSSTSPPSLHCAGRRLEASSRPATVFDLRPDQALVSPRLHRLLAG
jgi:hypothetical protein